VGDEFANPVQHDCMRVVAPPGTSDGGQPEWWGRYHEAFHAAMALIEAQRRDLTLAEATDVVVAECHKRGLEPSAEAVRGVARGALDPYWPFKHPLQAHREGWRWSPLGGWLRR
jgi:hypothetical protein